MTPRREIVGAPGRTGCEAVASGAKAAGRRPEDVDVAALISTTVSSSGAPDLKNLRSSLGFYAGFFPRYNRSLVESGFPEEASAIRDAFLDGRRGEDLARLVPDRMLGALAIIGTPEDCKGRLKEYQRSGVTLPMIAPRYSGEGAKERIMATIRACAPDP